MKMYCVSCGFRKAMARFQEEAMKVEHGRSHTVVKGLSGWRCANCGEIVFDADSARRYAAAGDELVLVSRKKQSRELRRIRQKLHLTQAQAARLTGGGHNAFSRYERGEAVPLPATTNLFKLLDRHPDLIKELA